MGSDDRTRFGEFELAGPGGVGAKIKGFKIGDIANLAGFGLMLWVSFMLYAHQTDAKDNGKQIAEAMKEANKEVSASLKESNQAVVKAIEQFAKEQKRANEIGREQTCLLTLPPDRRTNAGDFCKRLSRQGDQ